MKLKDLTFEYDEMSDVLYITLEKDTFAISEEEEPGVLWRHAFDDGRLVGVTIIDFDYYWVPRIDFLAKQFEEHFQFSAEEAKDFLSHVH